MTSAIKVIAPAVILAAAMWALASRGGGAGMTEDEWVHTAHSVQLRPPMPGFILSHDSISTRRCAGRGRSQT
jgi:hypothetical protein